LNFYNRDGIITDDLLSKVSMQVPHRNLTCILFSYETQISNCVYWWERNLCLQA